MGCIRHKDFTYKALNAAPGSFTAWELRRLENARIEDPDQAGGVLLGDHDHAESNGLQEPMQPSRQEFTVGPNVLEDFPPLPSRKLAVKTQSSNVAPKMKGRSANGMKTGLTEELGKITVVGQEMRTETTELRWPRVPSEAAAQTSPSAWSAATDDSGSHPSNAANNSMALSKPVADSVVPSSNEEVDLNQGNMMSDMSIANPDIAGFKAERFYNAITETYECPWALCGRNSYTEPDFEDHLRHDHEPSTPTCPRCQKRFKSLHALIAHCEAINGRCRIRHCRDYGAFIHRISGGFVSASVQTRDDPQLKNLGGDDTVNTVSYIEYVGEAPQELRQTKKWSQQQQQQYTQVAGKKIEWGPPQMTWDSATD